VSRHCIDCYGATGVDVLLALVPPSAANGKLDGLDFLLSYYRRNLVPFSAMPRFVIGSDLAWLQFWDQSKICELCSSESVAALSNRGVPLAESMIAGSPFGCISPASANHAAVHSIAPGDTGP
jgi:hypothetical protein